MGVATCLLTKADRYPVPNTKGTLVGGIFTLLSIVGLLVYVLLYYILAYSRPFPTETTVELFPQKNSLAQLPTLPRIRCLSLSGCWYREQVPPPTTDPTSTPPCFFIPQNSFIPTASLSIAHDSDPIDSFTVAWSSPDSVGLSYEVEVVTDYTLNLKTQTSPAIKSNEMFLPTGSDSHSPRYLLFAGLSFFSLVLTHPALSSSPDISTWSNTAVHEDPTPSDTFVCCFSDWQTIDATTMNPTTDPNKILGGKCTTDPNVKQLKIRPYPTYSSVTVLSPFSISYLLALTGGALAIIDLLVGGLSRVIVSRSSPPASTTSNDRDRWMDGGGGDLELHHNAHHPKVLAAETGSLSSSSPSLSHSTTPRGGGVITSPGVNGDTEDKGRFRIVGEDDETEV